MIKAVIFDLGGVIVGHEPMTKEIARILEVKDAQEFWHELNLINPKLCSGKMSSDSFWKKVIKKYSPKASLKEINKPWHYEYDKHTTLDEEVVELIKSLKKKYKLGLISNTIPEHTRFNRERGFFQYFDSIILSHEVGMSKDNIKIFHIALEELKVKAEESVFIDDTLEWVKKAKSIGMKGIHFKNAKQLEKELKLLLRRT